MAQYFQRQIINRPGFRLVVNRSEFTNVCFWYIPKYMRNQDETEYWWSSLYKVAPFIKDKMIKSGGHLTISYTPIHHRGLGNFFRMITNAHPEPTQVSMDFVIREIEKFGEMI